MKRLVGPTSRAALLFLVLAVIVTWPLALHMGSQVIGPFYGDNLEYVWKIWWVNHALLDLKQTPLIQPDIFYPFGYPLAYGEITPIHTYLGIPLTATLGPVATYNLFILASIALSGLFTYLFVNELTKSIPAGIVAGIGFALCPYHMARIAGNLPLIDTQWLPLFFLFLERFIRKASDRHDLGKSLWREAVLVGIFYAASALSSWYYAAAIGLLAPIYLVVRVGKGWRQQSLRTWLGGGLLAGLAAGVLILPFLLPYLSIQQAGAAHIPLEQTAFWSANLTDYIIPNPRHFLWGDWVERTLSPFSLMPYEFLLGWGLILSVLALFGWQRGRPMVGRGWGWWILISLILSLGPIIKLYYAMITFPVPAGLATAINGALDWLGEHSLAAESFSLSQPGRIAIPLPALLLRWFVPGLAGLRSWGRFAIFATFGVVVLAGAGTIVFLRELKGHRQRWVAASILAAMVFFEFYTGPQELITPGPRPVDEWLAAQSEPVTIIQMPLLVALSGPQMYYSMHHQQRVASGYGTYLPIMFEQDYPELQDFPSKAAVELLANWGDEGIDYVLIDEADVPADDPLWDAIAKQSDLEPVIELGGIWVYRVH